MFKLRILLIVCLVVSLISQSDAGRRKKKKIQPSANKWPQFTPTGIPFDTQCFQKGARRQRNCYKGGPFCTWYTRQDPTCYDRRFVSVTIPPNQVENAASIPLNVKFFQFNFGIHLVEGTFYKRFYSVTVDECARLCLRSAGGFESNPLERLRCLSFDFYPFEVPITERPFNEAMNKGVCVLNTETKNTARARNADQGLTHAEWYYKSHCSRRPFSPLEGYYEVRDPRGALTPLLEYEGPSSLGLESPWPGSRWGMFHPNAEGYIPHPINPNLTCPVLIPGDEFPGPVFRGGFTPVNDEQKCAGLMTKQEARDLCAERGGELCRNKADLDAISGRKLGCSFDQAGNGDIWHEGLPSSERGTPKKMYPRCCSSYTAPITNAGTIQTCSNYQQSNINFCNSKKTVTECLYSHNPLIPGTENPLSWMFGFATGLEEIRQQCANSMLDKPKFFRDCTGLDLGPWRTDTNCIWCPTAGLNPLGGNGQCRPGGNYGICPTASDQQRTTFGLLIRSSCRDTIVCDLAEAYPDLVPWLGNIHFRPGDEPPFPFGRL